MVEADNVDEVLAPVELEVENEDVEVREFVEVVETVVLGPEDEARDVVDEVEVEEVVLDWPVEDVEITEVLFEDVEDFVRDAEVCDVVVVLLRVAGMVLELVLVGRTLVVDPFVLAIVVVVR